MSNELVSICIPVYNGEETIRATLDSILAQTYKNIEVVVCEDGSTDNTAEIVRKYEIQDERVHLFINPHNLGLVDNWNECVSHSQGKYIHFVCADDIITPDCIEKKVKMIEKYDDMVLVFSATQIINDKDEPLRVRSFVSHDAVYNGLEIQKKSYRSRNVYGEPSNVLFRKEILDKTGLFSRDLHFTADWEMWLRMSGYGKVGYISEPLMLYRVFQGNGTSKLTYQKIKDDDKLMAAHVFSYEKSNITKADYNVHKIMCNIRMKARSFYMKHMIH